MNLNSTRELNISASNQRMKLVSTSDDTVVIRTTLRLFPGREVVCRLGSETIRATVALSHVCALTANSVEYLVSLALRQSAAAVTAGSEFTAVVSAEQAA